MTTNRKRHRDSQEGAVERYKLAFEEVELPEGETLEGDDELLLWRHYTKTRVAKDWRRFDLVQVVKAIKLETRLRDITDEIDSVGYLVYSEKGDVIPNPLIKVHDTFQRQQQVLIRGLGLSTTTTDRVRMNKQGKAAEQDADTHADHAELPGNDLLAGAS